MLANAALADPAPPGPVPRDPVPRDVLMIAWHCIKPGRSAAGQALTSPDGSAGAACRPTMAVAAAGLAMLVPVSWPGSVTWPAAFG
ncbi:MAG TPA: hypothetical protein VMB74_02985 [Streptosporangiaceae bacterium]|nr:hypothetical protein [Streptosporangiaceae bacterium]